MENATKAIIIAGAVLVAMVIVSIGVIMLSNVKPTTDEVNTTTDALAKKTFNSAFEKYVGTQKGSTINNLKSEVSAYNSGDHDHGTIQLNCPGTIYTYKDYVVSIPASGYTNGYVSRIIVTVAP